MIRSIIILILIIVTPVFLYAEDVKKPDDTRQVKLDMVSDTVSAAFSKVNAALQWNLDITMAPEKRNSKDQYTTNAIGQRVPKSTAIKSAGSLHEEQPL